MSGVAQFVSCPIRECGCEDVSCDGVLPVRVHEDCQEYDDGDTRFRLVCLKGDAPYELPGSYTQDELAELCRKFEAQAEKRTAGDSTNAQNPNRATPKKKSRRGRIGSRLKGKRTNRMLGQLADFKLWLLTNPVNERKPGCSVGERANQFWLSRQKTFERDRQRKGEEKGFGSAKTLAAAFRNSKP